MAWPYHILDLSKDQVHARRLLLDRYAIYAKLSSLIPILIYRLYRLGVWVYSERLRAKVDYDAVPSSPRLKHASLAKSSALATRWRKAVWWMEGEVAEGWGLRVHWITGGLWMSWLLFLCVHQTGGDYLHVTKRFGAIAASQFPLHYMLSMKNVYSPLAVVFQTSHEELNPYHRGLGRIIYSLLILHATWYLNFFIQAGLLQKRLTSKVVWIGIIALAMITLLASTSLQKVRRWSYRVFFVVHLVVGISILPLLFFHAPLLRMYVTEALVLFVIHILGRKLDTFNAFATITSIPHTKLVKISIPIPPHKVQRFKAAPGQHVYLQIPQESIPPLSSSPAFLHKLLYNPFTVASVSSTHLSLVLRTLHGPTTRALENLAQLTKASPPLNIEGPLGSSGYYFPNLAAEYDRILLVAGGVGATFILPIYRQLQETVIEEGKSREMVKMVWSMREGAEAFWAVDFPPSVSSTRSSNPNPSSSSNHSQEERERERWRPDEDENISIFFTRAHHRNSPAGIDGSVELDSFPSRNLKDGDLDMGITATGGTDRPDLRRIVDETFRLGKKERVAVLVCGPDGMARELRRYVGRWVEGGREVWFHDESFGW